MTYTINSTTSHSLTIEDYVDYLESDVDTKDQDSVLGSADALRALSNNPDVMVAKLNRELGDLLNFQSFNRYTAQTFTLASRGNFFVRANVWMPPAPSADVRRWEDALQAYELPHDHDFSFLTVGALGPGYETQIWEYDPDSVVGYVGERVDLTYLETTTLDKGKVMFYRASEDVHSQHHPKELSVSFNLIVVDREHQRPNQFVFDVENGTIASIPPNPAVLGPQVVCELAGYVGNSRTVNLLEDLTRSRARPRLRTAAYAALGVLEPHRLEELLTRGLADRDEYVRGVARDRLAALEVR